MPSRAHFNGFFKDFPLIVSALYYIVSLYLIGINPESCMLYQGPLSAQQERRSDFWSVYLFFCLYAVPGLASTYKCSLQFSNVETEEEEEVVSVLY